MYISISSSFYCKETIDLDKVVDFYYSNMTHYNISFARGLHCNTLSDEFLDFLDRTHLFDVLIKKGFKI